MRHISHIKRFRCWYVCVWCKQSRLPWHHHLHHHDVHRPSFLQCSAAQSGLTVWSHSRETTMTTSNLRWSSTTCLMMFLDHSMGRSVDPIILSTDLWMISDLIDNVVLKQWYRAKYLGTLVNNLSTSCYVVSLRACAVGTVMTLWLVFCTLWLWLSHCKLCFSVIINLQLICAQKLTEASLV